MLNINMYSCVPPCKDDERQIPGSTSGRKLLGVEKRCLRESRSWRWESRNFRRPRPSDSDAFITGAAGGSGSAVAQVNQNTPYGARIRLIEVPSVPRGILLGSSEPDRGSDN